MRKMTLKELYHIAYNAEPFDGKKYPGKIFYANIISYLVKQQIEKSNTISAIDIYCYYLDGLGLDLDDLEYCFEQIWRKDQNTDTYLYENFTKDPLFDNCRDKLQNMSAEDLNRIGINQKDCLNEKCNFDHNKFMFLTTIATYLSVLRENRNLMGRDYTQEKLAKDMEMFLHVINNNLEHNTLDDFIKTLSKNNSLGAKEVREVCNDLLDKCGSEYVDKMKDFYNHSVVNMGLESAENLSRISSKIIGQDFAVAKVKNRILSSMLGFKMDKKPIASFLLTGPTGVGKTETAKAVADACFNGNIYTVDMSTFKNKGDVSRLLGGSPNYVGYGDENLFCEFLLANPECVILFDEIEKANSECLDLLMRILDEGVFVNAKGQEISLENAIIFCTTNYTQNNKAIVGFGGGPNTDEKMTGNCGLKKELVGRFNEVIEYKQLSAESVAKIAKDNFLTQIISQFESKNPYRLKIGYTDDLLLQIAKKANTKMFGARDLKKSIQTEFIDKICEYIIVNRPTNKMLIVNGSGEVTEHKIQEQEHVTKCLLQVSENEK